MKFTKYCPQTSTGLWSGITEKPKMTESEMREEITYMNNDSLQFAAAFMTHFHLYVLSIDYMREWIDLMDEDYRKKFEQQIKNVLIGFKWAEDLKNKKVYIEKKDVIKQNQIINCITYVRSGLVKYFKELNDVVR